MAKVKHGPEEDWNNHPSDVANLTTYVEQQWGLDLTWQILDMLSKQQQTLQRRNGY
jgi:hypothetical protein